MRAEEKYERLRRDAEARHLTEAQRVLAARMHFNRAARGHGGPEVEILQAWVDDLNAVCAI